MSYLNRVVNGNLKLKVFTGRCSFFSRFMVDNDIVGCNWIELPAGKYRIRKESQVDDQTKDNAIKVSIRGVYSVTSLLDVLVL